MSDVNLRESLLIAIDTERKGQELYKELENRFADKDSEISLIFHQLAKDEKKHERFFHSLLVDAPTTPEGEVHSRDAEFLKAATISRFFERSSEELARSIESVENALTLAFQFEKTTLMFYLALDEVIGRQEQALAEVIHAEKEHMNTLMKIILTEARFRGLGDQWW